MASYLQPTEYQTYGLAADVTDDWITAASSLIDSHCRRTSLNPTQYSERLRIVEGSQTARLSHLPLAPIAPATLPFVSIQARYGKPRRGQIPSPAPGRSDCGPFPCPAPGPPSIPPPSTLSPTPASSSSPSTSSACPTTRST